MNWPHGRRVDRLGVLFFFVSFCSFYCVPFDILTFCETVVVCMYVKLDEFCAWPITWLQTVAHTSHQSVDIVCRLWECIAGCRSLAVKHKSNHAGSYMVKLLTFNPQHCVCVCACVAMCSCVDCLFHLCRFCFHFNFFYGKSLVLEQSLLIQPNTVL